MLLNEFAFRLSELRIQKGVSARDMSLSLGMSSSYINQIESGKNYPSIPAFFDICEYLGVSPQEFFDTGNRTPEELNDIIANLKTLDGDTLALIDQLIHRLK